MTFTVTRVVPTSNGFVESYMKLLGTEDALSFTVSSPNGATLSQNATSHQSDRCDGHKTYSYTLRLRVFNKVLLCYVKQ